MLSRERTIRWKKLVSLLRGLVACQRQERPQKAEMRGDFVEVYALLFRESSVTESRIIVKKSQQKRPYHMKALRSSIVSYQT